MLKKTDESCGTEVCFHRRGAEAQRQRREKTLRKLCVSASLRLASNQECTLGVCQKLFILLLLAFSSCQKPSFEPVALVAEDMCSFCRMAISEKQYAAEIIPADGQAIKFDDLACLVNYVEGKSLDIKAWYAIDYGSRQWIEARKSHFVRSSELTTPMGGQMIAFKDRSQAEAAAKDFHGKLLAFDDLFRKQ